MVKHVELDFLRMSELKSPEIEDFCVLKPISRGAFGYVLFIYVCYLALISYSNFDILFCIWVQESISWVQEAKPGEYLCHQGSQQI